MTNTTNYQLPQWEATDRIKRSDFNAAMQSIDTALAGAAKIAWGSYNGTNQYGRDLPNSISCGFTPKFVLILPDTATSMRGFFIRPATTSATRYDSYSYVFLTWTDTGVSWYGNSGFDEQLNRSGTTYYWFALG